MVKRRTPLTPILDNKTRRGAVQVGNSPGSPLLPAAPTTLAVVGSVQETAWFDAYGDVAILASGHAVACGVFDGVAVCDASDPTNPVITDVIWDGTLHNSCYGIDTYGNYAVVSVEDANRLNVIDCTDPSNIAIVGGVADASDLAYPYGVRVYGDYALVACWSSLTAVDVSVPSAPVIVDSLLSADLLNAFYLDVDATQGIAYVSCSTGKVVAVDVSDPTGLGLSVLGVETGVGSPSRMVNFVNDYVYTSDRDVDSIFAIDVSNPAAPDLLYTLVDSTNLIDSIRAAYRSGHLVITQHELEGVAAVDISDPSAMSITDVLTDPVLERATGIARLDATHFIVTTGLSYFVVVSFT